MAPLCLIATLTILSVQQVSTLQTTSTVNSSGYTNGPLDNTVHHPSVGLPIGSWNILDLNSTSKANVCNDQLLFCDKQCGDPNSTSLNFCNVNTMAWGCDCKTKIPDCPPYQWPVSIAECRGREDACNNGCAEGTTKELCADGCKRYYRCNMPGGIPSALRTNTSDEKPIYNIPIPNQATLQLTAPTYSILLPVIIFIGLLGQTPLSIVL